MEEKSTRRKKPTTQEELEQDLVDHPERGMLDGEDVVRFDKTTLQFAIPKEMYRVMLEIGAAKGLSQTQIFIDAFSQYISSPGNIALVQHWQQIKAEKHNVSRFTIRGKVLGSYKKVGRERRRRMDENV
jgi:hypothetical protein